MTKKKAHATPDETETVGEPVDIERAEELELDEKEARDEWKDDGANNEVETAAGEEPGEQLAAEDYVVGPDGARWAKGDTVKIAETFPSYRGAEGTITALRADPIGGNFYVADVQLTKQTAVGTNEPIWFNNVPLSQLEKA